MRYSKFKLHATLCICLLGCLWPSQKMSRFFVTRMLDLYKVYQNMRWKGYENLDDSRVPHLQQWFKVTLKRSFALHSIFHFFLNSPRRHCVSNSPSCGADFGGGGGRSLLFDHEFSIHWKPKQVFCIVYSRIGRSNKPSFENIRSPQPNVRVYTFCLCKIRSQGKLEFPLSPMNNQH